MKLLLTTKSDKYNDNRYNNKYKKIGDEKT